MRRVRALIAVALLCGSTAARAQTDTSRKSPPSRVLIRTLVSDSALANDIETVTVVRSAESIDRLGVERRRRMLDTLAAQRRLWEERRPRAYIIRSVRQSDCIVIRSFARSGGRPVTDQLVVRDTTIVNRIAAPIADGFAHECPLDWRVDDLFADIERALSDTSVSVRRLQYDAAYAFPRSYWLEWGSPYVAKSRPPTARDGGVLVESFAPTPRY